MCRRAWRFFGAQDPLRSKENSFFKPVQHKKQLTTIAAVSPTWNMKCSGHYHQIIIFFRLSQISFKVLARTAREPAGKNIYFWKGKHEPGRVILMLFSEASSFLPVLRFKLMVFPYRTRVAFCPQEKIPSVFLWLQGAYIYDTFFLLRFGKKMHGRSCRKKSSLFIETWLFCKKTGHVITFF